MPPRAPRPLRKPGYVQLRRGGPLLTRADLMLLGLLVPEGLTPQPWLNRPTCRLRGDEQAIEPWQPRTERRQWWEMSDTDRMLIMAQECN